MNNFKLRQAALMLRQGGVVAYPTEGVYGLGCDPLEPAAVERILDIKGRAAAKGLILIAADFDALRPFLSEPGSDLMRRVTASWPGPHTWLFEAAPHTPSWLTGGRDTIAVRVTAHPLSAGLCRAFGGAVVSTSANRSGRPPARSALSVRHLLPDVDLILHGALGGLEGPTTIQDARSGALIRG